jgi:gluconolactonase
MKRIVGLLSSSIILLGGYAMDVVLTKTVAIARSLADAEVRILDPAASKIVPTNLVVEQMATGFKFTEGPLWHREGYLIFSDTHANTVYKLDAEGNKSVFLKNSGYLAAPPQQDARGSNGITYDKQGNLLLAQHGDRAVIKLAPDGSKEKIVDAYNGKKLNSPNDLVVKSDGAIYFTDPPYGLPKLNDDPDKQQKVNGIYRYYDGKLTLLASDLTYPNGLAFSPDEKFLYVGSSDPENQVLMRYSVNEDGTLGKGEVFAKTFVDGLKVDTQGNLYLATSEGIKIYSPNGTYLAAIALPEEPANLAWGGEGYRTLYITARTSIYRLTLKQAGIQP